MAAAWDSVLPVDTLDNVLGVERLGDVDGEDMLEIIVVRTHATRRPPDVAVTMQARLT